MKKTVFAAQVFGLIAMVPIVVILEMNHVAVHGKTTSASIKTIQNTETTLPGKLQDKLPDETFSVSLEKFLFKAAW